jgi:hypothetical protein
MQPSIVISSYCHLQQKLNSGTETPASFWIQSGSIPASSDNVVYKVHKTESRIWEKKPHALQMKGCWESNINVWFPLMCSQKWNWYFQNRIIMFHLPVPTLIYMWEIYIFLGLVWLFCCREICGSILGIYKLLADTWMWKLGLRPRFSQKRNT